MHRAYLGHPTKTGDAQGYLNALQFFLKEFPRGFTAWECHGGWQGKIISGIILEVANDVSYEEFYQICCLYDAEFGQSSHIIIEITVEN